MDWDDSRSKPRRGKSGTCLKRSLTATFLMAIGFIAYTLLSITSGSRRAGGVGVVVGSTAPTMVSQGEVGADAAASSDANPGFAWAVAHASNATSLARASLGDSARDRLATDQQRQEWDSGLIRAVLGEGSCDAICAAVGGGACARDWFAFFDSCEVVGAVMMPPPQGDGGKGRGSCSLTQLGQAGPGVVLGDRRAFAGHASKRGLPSCGAASRAGETRLCPCVPGGNRRAMAPPGVKEVGQALVGALEAEADDVPGALLSQVTWGDVTFLRGSLGESCGDVCKPHGLRCSPDWFPWLNRCEALKAAWPTDKTGSPFASCFREYYGHDLPGYSEGKSQLLLNNDIKGFPATCGGRGDGTRRLCPCVYMYPQGTTTFHTVFSVQSKQYFEWQSRYLNFWHKQVKQPGKITRLLSMGGAWPRDPAPHPFGDHIMHEVPTHVAPEYDSAIDTYTAYNKPLSIAHWLQHATVTEDVIIILDPDCAFVEPSLLDVEEGSPVGNQGYYSFKEKAGFELAILKHYCRGICTHFDPIAVPVIIHRKDLERIAPLWLKYTEDIRRDREGPNKWPIQWNSNKYVVNRIEWVAEMFGYVLAAAHLGLRHELVDLQMVPSVHRSMRPGVPFLHFHIGIETSDKKKWGKTHVNAHQTSPWPVPPGTDAVTTRMLQALHDAREAVGQTKRTQQNKWGDYWSVWLNPMNETESE